MLRYNFVNTFWVTDSKGMKHDQFLECFFVNQGCKNKFHQASVFKSLSKNFDKFLEVLIYHFLRP